MELFGMGPAELFLILIVVLVIFGPEQLPEIAKKIGNATREIQENVNAITREVNQGVQPYRPVEDASSPPADPAAQAPAPAANLILADEESVQAIQEQGTQDPDGSSPT